MSATIRIIDGQSFQHIHSQRKFYGLKKKPKLANWNDQDVSRLVEVLPEDPQMSNERIRLFSQGIELANRLQRVPGIYRHINQCIVDRIKNKEFEGQKKIESYDVFYQYGDLANYLHSHVVNEPTKILWARTLLYALCQMHRNHIYHLDIKPENILVSDNDHLAICDFDNAWTPGYLSNLHYYTSEYSPPEFLKKIIKYGESIPKDEAGLREYEEMLEKRDVWAMGMVLYRIFTGKSLHSRKNLQEAEINDIPFIQEKPMDPLMLIVWLMLRPNPDERITAQEAFDQLSQT